MSFDYHKTGNELIDDFILLLKKDCILIKEKIDADLYDYGETSKVNVLKFENFKDKFFISVLVVDMIRSEFSDYSRTLTDSQIFKMFFDKYTDLLARDVARGDFNIGY